MKKILSLLFLCKLSYMSATKPYMTILSRGIGTNETPEAMGGPKEVRASLCRGLNQLGVSYNYNPSQLADVATIVLVASSTTLLTQMTEQKKNRTIDILLAGPNFHIEGPALSPELDAFLIPSEQMLQIWSARRPQLKNLYCWPAGINTDLWKPSPSKRQSRTVLIYEKNVGDYLVNLIFDLLKRHNWEPIVLKYGSYNHETFKNILDHSRFAIFLTRFESQGLAMAEAWSMNIPTLCFNPEVKVRELPDLNLYYPSCPLLTEQTGKKWKTLSDLEQLIAHFESFENEFSPRAWILNNLTDAVCAQRLLDIIQQLKSK